MAIKPWKCIKAQEGEDLKLFRVQHRWMQNPRNGKILKRLVLETGDWVNVIAITPEETIVFVRQYRFGTGKISLEIPGGLIDPGEDSRQAALRELKEETGYTSGNWQHLGAVEPNPAFLNNCCNHWLALDVQQTAKPAPDEGEDIEVLALTFDEILQHIRSGEIRHVLVLSALSRLDSFWKKYFVGAGSKPALQNAGSKPAPDDTD
jgi:ADP-ribose pyrophosphatase